MSMVLLCLNVCAQSEASFASRVERNFQEARARFQKNTNDAEAAWQLGRACFDWAEFAKDNQQREAIAQEGIAACRHLIRQQPKLAAGHYYLGMNLGQLARTKTVGALKIVDEMERVFKTARQLDAQMDYAGPDRNLGLLYFQTPGWPASIGSKSKARLHLERAVELSPRYPENGLCLIEAYLKWGETRNVQREFRRLARLWPEARKEFAGETWALSWLDWDRRWKRIEERVSQLK